MAETIFKEEPCDKCENTGLLPVINKYACLCDNVPEETPPTRPEHFN